MKVCIRMKSLVFATLVTMVVAAPAFAAPISDCKIEFKTTGSPVLISIEGKSEIPCAGQLEVQGEDLSKSKITLDLSKLDTGIPLRNKHLKENYLQISQFPQATLSNLKVSDFAKTLKGQGQKSKFEATLDLHGAQKPISGTYTIKDGVAYKADFHIEVTDFNIARPDFMGVKVVDKVFLTVQFKHK